MIYFITNQTRVFEPDPSIIQVSSSMDIVYEYLDSVGEFGVDVETTGLNFLQDRLISIQVGDANTQFFIDYTTVDVSGIAHYLQSDEKLKILHNVKFDYLFILKNLGIKLENVYDTMLVDKVLTTGKNGEDSKLSTLAAKELQIYLNKSIAKTFNGTFTERQIIYGAEDVKVLPMLKEKQSIQISQNNLKNVVKLENNAVLAFADMEFNGMAIDEKAWLKAAESSKAKLLELEKVLYDRLKSTPRFSKFLPKSFNLDMFLNEEESFDIALRNYVNWNSPKQVLDIFKTIVPALDGVGRPVLLQYKGRHPIIADYIHYKEQSKLYSSYGPTFLDLIDVDGRIHTSFNQILDTGRVSSSKPKLNWAA